MSLYVDIEKRLGSFVLRSSFETDEKMMALAGASGCGKSLTLKCIAGIVTPDRGRIVLDGISLFDSDRKINIPPQERHVGYLFQHYALFPNMTVSRNIMCGIHSGSAAERKARTKEFVERFRLEGLGEYYPVQLSGGQQQRVALARIMASDPKAILLDEPFSAMDGFLSWNLESELAEMLSGFSGPLIWVSHDMGECCRNCQTVCVMEKGSTYPVTDIEEMLSRPSSVSAARLAGCRNFLKVHKTEGGICIDSWDIELPIEAAADAKTLAVMPAGITVTEAGFRARILRRIRDVKEQAAIIGPVEGSGAASLYVRLPEPFCAEEGAEVFFSIDPDECILMPE